MSLRRFRRTYSAEILTHSGENTMLCDLYDWKGLFPKRLDPEGTNLIDFLSNDINIRNNLRDELNNAPKTTAHFAELELKSEINTKADIDIPNVLQQLKAELDVDTISSFNFLNVKQRVLPNELRIKLKHMLEELRESDHVTYRREIRGLLIIDNIFYANEVEIKLNRGIDISAEARAAVENIGGTASFSSDRELTIRYNQSDCPFAAEFKKGKDF